MSKRLNSRAVATTVLLIIFFAAFVAGCSNTSKEKDAGRVVIERYFRDIKKFDYNRAFANYSPAIYESTGFSKWFKGFKSVHESLGRVKEYSLGSSILTVKEGTKEEGILIVYNYRVNYTIKKTKEKFLLFKPKGEGEYLIISHNISPDDS